MKKLFFFISVLLLTSQTHMMHSEEKATFVLMETSMGKVKIKLYNETPKHRDNFIKLVNEGYFNNLLFHRVIKDFMIQGGDPESRNAPAGKQLGSGGPGYTIPAEFVYPKYFHKRGALSAARTGDQVNPQKASSGSQFYIVWGQVYKASDIDQLEAQKINQAKNAYFQQLAGKQQSKIQQLYQVGDQAGLQKLQNELIAQMESYFEANPPQGLSPEQIKAYTSLGGTPHLDNEYTVFGEVVEGLEVVGKIQSVETGTADRPKTDVVILSMQVIGN
jgi:peptidylprolyl isomerase